jgi:hypothetical protein
LNAEVNERRVRRIVVVFGGGSSDMGVAGVLASLASEGAADIAAVFLEDQMLFRLAELPFTTELCRITTTQRPLTTGELERQMKVQAVRAERAVRRIAERAGLSWSFRTKRGRLDAALVGARDVDLLLLGTQRRSLAPSGEARAMTWALRTDEVEALRPVAVLLDQASSGAELLDAGIRLAKATGRGVILFLSDEAAEAQPDLARRLEALGPKRSAIQRVSSPDRDPLFALMRRAAPAVLIVSAGDAGFEESNIDALQRQLSCPVVVVRATSD